MGVPWHNPISYSPYPVTDFYFKFLGAFNPPATLVVDSSIIAESIWFEGCFISTFCPIF
jgi:hypothetical protein